MTEIKNYNLINELQNHPDNKKCADCALPAEGYICTDYGIFLCFDCSSVHRDLKHKVKKNTETGMTEEDADIMKNHGNKASANKWMVRYTGSDMLEPGYQRDRSLRVAYINKKYVERTWARADAGPVVYQKPKEPVPSSFETSRSDNVPIVHVYSGPVFVQNMQQGYSPSFGTSPYGSSYINQQQQQQLHQQQQQMQQTQMQQMHMQQQHQQQQQQQQSPGFAIPTFTTNVNSYNNATSSWDGNNSNNNNPMISPRLNNPMISPRQFNPPSLPSSSSSLPSWDGNNNPMISPRQNTPSYSSPQLPPPSYATRSMSPITVNGPYSPATLSNTFNIAAPLASPNHFAFPQQPQPQQSFVQMQHPQQQQQGFAPIQQQQQQQQQSAFYSPTTAVHHPTPTQETSLETSAGVASRARAGSKTAVQCPQCGKLIDSRELGKHKIRDCVNKPN